MAFEGAIKFRSTHAKILQRPNGPFRQKTLGHVPPIPYVPYLHFGFRTLGPRFYLLF